METKASILVVDDENTVQLLLKSELKKAGYDVALAKNADETLGILKKRRFGAALVDMRLGDDDGIELLRKCKAHDPDMELILMTAYASLQSAIEAIKIGIFDYITKPFDHIPSVIHRVSRAVERRSQRDVLRNLVECLGNSNRELAMSMQMLQKTYLETAKAISRILGLRHPSQNDKNQRMQSLAVGIGTALGLEAEEIGWVSVAALLRDVGKPEETGHAINKSDGLEVDEFDQIKVYPAFGADLLAPIPGLEPLAQIVRQHHERFDGSGNPDGLSGEGISLAARILAVAESYVTMTSASRDAMTKDAAVQEMLRRSGTQFDPHILDVCVQLLSHGDPGAVAQTNVEHSGGVRP